MLTIRCPGKRAAAITAWVRLATPGSARWTKMGFHGASETSRAWAICLLRRPPSTYQHRIVAQ